MTKEEINEIIKNNIWWQEDDDACQMSDDIADKVIAVITKKLDKKIKHLTNIRTETSINLNIDKDIKKEAITFIDGKIEALVNFKEELEK
ncbi:MAG: hypothetical protein DA328_09200 [Nitrososphaeraceae archaeon]|nr:hypothetical protein [Nitrososphaeraceae archaeon]